MKARRTPWWCYVLAAALGLLAGIGLAKYGEISGFPLVGAPWIVPVVLAILGFVVLYMALQIHKYTTTDPEKRAQLKPLDPQKAFATLVSCKALGVAGASLAGWYGGQLIMSLPHGEPSHLRMRDRGNRMHNRYDHWHCGGVAVPNPTNRRPGKSENEDGHATQSLRGRGYQISDTIESLITSLLRILFGNANHHLLGHAGNKFAILRIHLRLTQATAVSCGRRILHIQMPLIDINIAIPPHRMIDRSKRNTRRGNTQPSAT